MEIIKKEGCCDIFSWCPEIEEGALDQMSIISGLPFVKHCALMPDAHFGMQMPIGGVVACDNVVVPNFVGVDIGCGMGAIRTSINKDELESTDVRKNILNSLSRGIPVGFSHNNDHRRSQLMDLYTHDYIVELNKNVDQFVEVYNPLVSEDNIFEQFFGQLGTLGGGNHFCEIQYDDSGNVWVMLHSGSRNIGHKIGEYFNKIAEDRNNKWYSVNNGIPFLPVDSDEGKAYLGWMNFALKFAYMNRMVMLNEVKRNLVHQFPDIEFTTDTDFSDAKDGMINIHHNFAAIESHMGKNYWIHRKGATRAFEGKTGIIPGSMGTSSYIVKGLANKLSLSSCSHGAGRKMGRMAFCRQMADKHDEIEKSLDGVVHSKFSTIKRGKQSGMTDVSEAPAAYKDIEDVMSNQVDLVKPIVKLKPLICLKG